VPSVFQFFDIHPHLAPVLGALVKMLLNDIAYVLAVADITSL
jgi:hypothetical protein